MNETIVQFEQAVLSLLGASQGQAALAQLEAARTHVNAQLDEALAQCRAAVALVEQVAIVQRMLTSVTVPTIPLPAR